MFGINKGRRTTLFLNFRYGVQCQRRLTRTLWAVNLNDTPLWISTAERQIERQRTRRHDLDVRLVKFAKFHDRAIAKLFGDLLHRQTERL